MSNDGEFLFYRREWLNAPGQGNGFVEADIRKPYREDEYSYYEGGQLTIKDCTRQITLSFPVSGVERRENSLAKIAGIINVLEGFQAVLLHTANKAEEMEKKLAEATAEKEAINKPILERFMGRESDECDCPRCVS